MDLMFQSKDTSVGREKPKLGKSQATSWPCRMLKGWTPPNSWHWNWNPGMHGAQFRWNWLEPSLLSPNWMHKKKKAVWGRIESPLSLGLDSSYVELLYWPSNYLPFRLIFPSCTIYDCAYVFLAPFLFLTHDQHHFSVMDAANKLAPQHGARRGS